jgi:hypothetical protein
MPGSIDVTDHRTVPPRAVSVRVQDLGSPAAPTCRQPESPTARVPRLDPAGVPPCAGALVGWAGGGVVGCDWAAVGVVAGVGPGVEDDPGAEGEVSGDGEPAPVSAGAETRSLAGAATRGPEFSVPP